MKSSRPISRITQRRLPAAILLLTILLTLPAIAPAQTMEQAPDLPRIDAAQQAAIIDSVTTALNEGYIFDDKALEMERHVRAKLAKGGYRGVDSVSEFVALLTEDLREICHDRHLSVRVEGPRPEPVATQSDHERQQAEEDAWIARMKRNNFGFRKIEHLTGNVGYLKLDGFNPAEYAGETAIAAMNYLANSSALIIDLRENGGGSPSMIQLISSYLFQERTHLNSFYIRKGDITEQYWTQAHIQGPRMTGMPVYVLTSSYTFSAAEEFTYNLKNLERATIVGETTGGGAHPVNRQWFAFPGFTVTMSLPFGRAINPITGTNWEGTGIEPHIQVPADEALAAAHRDALEKMRQGAQDPDLIFAMDWAIAGLQAASQPVELSNKELKQFVGNFGPRKITLSDGALLYQREDRPHMTLVPMGDDRFMVADLGYFRIQFERDERGKVVRLIGMYDNGRTDADDRS